VKVTTETDATEENPKEVQFSTKSVAIVVSCYNIAAGRVVFCPGPEQCLDTRFSEADCSLRIPQHASLPEYLVTVSLSFR
jgi:hypothetical protein